MQVEITADSNTPPLSKCGSCGVVCLTCPIANCQKKSILLRSLPSRSTVKTVVYCEVCLVSNELRGTTRCAYFSLSKVITQLFRSKESCLQLMAPYEGFYKLSDTAEGGIEFAEDWWDQWNTEMGKRNFSELWHGSRFRSHPFIKVC